MLEKRLNPCYIYRDVPLNAGHIASINVDVKLRLEGRKGGEGAFGSKPHRLGLELDLTLELI